MTEGMSAAELLLSNLTDHRVIRIDGGEEWMTHLTGQVKRVHPDYLEITGALELEPLMAKLARHLGIHAEDQAIREALSHRSVTAQSLLLISDVQQVDEDALHYLLSLTEITANDQQAVTVLLCSTPELVHLLQTVPALGGRLDGYYQEEVSRPAAESVQRFKPLYLIAAMLLIMLLAVIGFLTASDETALLPEAESMQQESSQVSSLPSPVAEPESMPSDEVAPQAAAEPEQLPVEPAKPVLAEPASIDSAAKSAKAETAEDKQLLTELAEVVNRALPQKAHPEPQQQPQLVAEPEVASDTESQTPDVTLNQEPAAEAPAEIAPVLPAIGQPAPELKISDEVAVRQLVAKWAQAWQEQDWDNYIACYVPGQLPFGMKMSLPEWLAFRKQRLLSPEWIRLNIGELRLNRLDPHWYRVEFYQRFEKPGYADETTKRLELKLTPQGWRIATEAPKGTVVLKRGL